MKALFLSLFILLGLAHVDRVDGGVILQSYRLAASGQPEKFTVDFTGKTGADFITATNALSFIFAIPNDVPNYYQPWFQTGTEGDPVTAGTTIEVDIDVADNAAAIAQKFLTDMSAATGWSGARVGAVVTMTASSNGNLVDAADIDSGLTIITTQQGTP